MSPVPHRSEDFRDILDPRFERIIEDRLRQLDDFIPTVFTTEPTNGRDEMKFSAVGTLDDWEEFEGEVVYDSISQGYDVTLIPVEFVKGIQVTRKLFDDGLFGIMDQKPKAMALSWNRTRQKHGARVFNNAFAVDTYFYNHSENVALCSKSHTTTAPDTSTATGFDNLGVTELSAVALSTARLQMKGFRGDRAERISVIPDELWVPNDLEEQAWEIVNSAGKPDTDLNNENFHQRKWSVHAWDYIDDANDWFVADSQMRRDNLLWSDRVAREFAMIEDFDTIVGKWRGYGRYGWAYLDWRWIQGNQVS